MSPEEIQAEAERIWPKYMIELMDIDSQVAIVSSKAGFLIGALWVLEQQEGSDDARRN